ncbi:MAG: DNA-3-methyladenine glycosylase family protein [Gaiellales bacterium]
MLEFTLQPAAPYLLRASAGPPDACRRYRAGVLEMVYRAGAEHARARVWQLPDGSLSARIDADQAEPAHDRLCEILQVRLDHRPFLSLADRDPLLRPLRSRMAGYRTLLLASPEQALVRAIAGQLIRASDAYRIESRLLADLMPFEDGFRLPPAACDLAAAHPARFERAGLSPARAVVLSRAARLDWGGLAAQDTPRIEARLRTVRGLGPWSAGVVLTRGFGRPERGLVGDLALIKLASALSGRAADADDTARLLDRYGPWAGLASAWLLTHPLAHARGVSRLRKTG